MTRDLTKQQFLNKLEKYNIKPAGCGYFVVTYDEKGRDKLHAYGPNGGDKRRSQLAYLIARQKDELAKG